MKDYPENVPWSAVLIAFAQLAVVIAVMAVVYLVTRVTPEREAELKAQGAAEADRKAEASGGWSAWIAGEISADADGQDARRPSVASADGQDARRPSWEVR